MMGWVGNLVRPGGRARDEAPAKPGRLSRPALIARLLVFAIWLGLVLFMTAQHAFWRDEVRALSIALHGPGLVDMLGALHGEGHPAVWYLLLRGAYDVVGSPVVLPLVSMTIASTGALLLLFASPLPLWLVALILGSGHFLFEYSVMARNYGLSAPVLFLMAYLYPTRRDRGVSLGLLAVLLANTNAHSVLLVCAFMLFWLIDLVRERGLSWNRSLRHWALNGAIAGLGIVVCIVTIYPPVNDAATMDRAAITLRSIGIAVLIPASSFGHLLQTPAAALDWGPVSDYPASISRRLLSVLMVGALLGLVRWPAALIAGAASLWGMGLFFVLVYPGSYRHDGLWLLFLIALYWMAQARGRGPLQPGRDQRVRRAVGVAGLACFVALMLLQVPVGLRALADSLPGGRPASRVRDLARLLQSRADLKDAILLPDPDHLLEAMPYYAPNLTYLPRQQRFARYARFSKQGLLDLSLGDLLTDAKRLCRDYAKPVVLVLQQDLDQVTPPQRLSEGYNWHLDIGAGDIRALRSATEFLGRFERASQYEVFGAYVLRPPCAVSR